MKVIGDAVGCSSNFVTFSTYLIHRTMKNRIIYSLALLFAIAAGASGQQKEVASDINSVTVFYQGAQISRTSAEVTLPAQQTVLVLKGLEQSLQENSLRVGIKGQARILNVVKSMDFLEEKTSSAKIEALQLQLKGNNEEIENFRMKIKVYEQERNLLMTNMNLGGANTGVTVDQIREGATYYRARLLEVERTILETNRLIIKIQEENQRIQSQLRELNYQKNRPTSRVEVTVEPDRAGICQLFLDYIVPEAGWIASYDLRIDEVDGPVKVVRKAALRQSTGEDWNRVSLSFSTGNPMEQQVMPVLKPWYVDFVQPRQNMLMMQGKLPGVSKSANRQQQPQAQKMDAEMAYAEEAISYDAVAPFESASKNSIQEFTLQTKASISADGKEYAFSLGTEELQASYHYQAIPKKEKAAYLVATLTNWEGYELVDGTANIYYEKMYIGETYLSTSMTLDSMQLSMGRDKGIVIERKVVKDYTKSRTMGSNVRKNFGYELIVRNTKSTQVSLVLEDQIPVSSNSQIVVDDDDLGGGTLDAGSGKVTWRLTVNPGETITVPLRYNIRYPKDQSIGL